MGVSSSESEEAWTADPANVSGYALIGCCRAMFANRISYTFDFKGNMKKYLFGVYQFHMIGHM